MTAPRSIALLTSVLAIVLSAGIASAACSETDPRHEAWTSILSQRVNEARVDYKGLGREDGAALSAYLKTLSVPARGITSVGLGTSASPSGSTPATPSR